MPLQYDYRARREVSFYAHVLIGVPRAPLPKYRFAESSPSTLDCVKSDSAEPGSRAKEVQRRR